MKPMPCNEDPDSRAGWQVGFNGSKSGAHASDGPLGLAFPKTCSLWLLISPSAGELEENMLRNMSWSKHLCLLLLFQDAQEMCKAPEVRPSSHAVRPGCAAEGRLFPQNRRIGVSDGSSRACAALFPGALSINRRCTSLLDPGSDACDLTEERMVSLENPRHPARCHQLPLPQAVGQLFSQPTALSDILLGCCLLAGILPCCELTELSRGWACIVVISLRGQHCCYFAGTLLTHSKSITQVSWPCLLPLE